ncbi:DUF4127 family protein [soil metagenome]
MKLLLVPPDTRPPTLSFPVGLARAVGWEVATPPPKALNYLNRPGDFGALKSWLEEHVPNADVLILSLEMLCLGGMIPARIVDTALEIVLERLELLTDLKRLNPDLKILAGGVVVRVAHDNDPLEEKPYYGEHGPALRLYSETFDRFERYGTKEDEIRLQRALAALPADILDNWLATRKRNHQLHLSALELAHSGIIDPLCLTLDDTSTYGLAAHDRRGLEAKTDALGLWSKVDIYPGADEVPATLLARALPERPTKVFVRYSGTLGAAAELLYEDRPAGELVAAHLRAAGCVQTETLAEADLVLAVNTPATKQAGAQPDFATVDTPARHLPAFVDFVARQLDAGTPVAIADIAYANGAERRLMTMLDTLPLNKLAGFSAWNTAGNTLGGALAMGVVAGHVQNRAVWTETLFNRFVDDYLYQARVREGVRQQLHNPSPFDLGEQLEEAEYLVGRFIKPLARALWDKHFAENDLTLHWQTPTLAWPRLFTGVFPFTVEATGSGNGE